MLRLACLVSRYIIRVKERISSARRSAEGMESSGKTVQVVGWMKRGLGGA